MVSAGVEFDGQPCAKMTGTSIRGARPTNQADARRQYGLGQQLAQAWRCVGHYQHWDQLQTSATLILQKPRLETSYFRQHLRGI